MVFDRNNFRRVFSAFLKEQKLLGKYKRAVGRKVSTYGYVMLSYGGKRYYSLESVLKRINSENTAVGIIDYSVVWSETEEGIDFWFNTNRKFDAFFKTIEKEKTRSR